VYAREGRVRGVGRPLIGVMPREETQTGREQTRLRACGLIIIIDTTLTHSQRGREAFRAPPGARGQSWGRDEGPGVEGGWHGE
jgi:hypothetical protein